MKKNRQYSRTTSQKRNPSTSSFPKTDSHSDALFRFFPFNFQGHSNNPFPSVFFSLLFLPKETDSQPQPSANRMWGYDGVGVR